VTEVLVVMLGYFEAMNIPTLRGRVFTDQDRAGTVVISRTMARQFHKDEESRREAACDRVESPG